MSTPSPISALYLHVQHSVCAWCCLRDLAFLSRVNRSWRGATASSPSIGAHVWLTDALWIVAQSGLGRHVSELYNSVGSSNVLLNDERSALVAAKLPLLRRIVCSLMVPFARPPSFPASLTSLRLNLWNPRHQWGYAPGSEFSMLIGALPAVAHLRSFVLWIPDSHADSNLSFEPLQRCAALRDFSLSCKNLSDAHVDQLRELKQLQFFACTDPDELLPRLLRPPHDLQWQCIDATFASMVLTERGCDALASIRSLTRLDVNLKSGSPSFLAAQPNLTSLRFTHDREIEADQFREALSSCHALTELTLHHCRSLLDPQLGSILAGMPQLTRLELSHVPWLMGLSCLDQAHLAQRLQILHLGGGTYVSCQHLRSILTLRHLTHLDLTGWLVNRQMDPELLAQLMPPSQALPLLVVFEPTPSKLVQLPVYRAPV